MKFYATNGSINLLQKRLLLVVFGVFFGHFVQVNAQKNPNRVVKKYARHIAKGKAKDSIQAMTFILNALSDTNLKKKFVKLGRETVQKNYRETVQSAEERVESSITNARRIQPYDEFMAYENGIKKIEYCKKFSDKVVSAGISGVTTKDVIRLEKKAESYRIAKEGLRSVACEDLYKKASEIISQNSSDKRLYRKAYNNLTKVKSLIFEYKKSDSLQKIAQERGTTRVQLISVRGNEEDFSEAIVNNVEKAITEQMEKHDKSTPFFRVGWGIENADIRVRVVLTAKVTREREEPEYFDREKTVKNDLGVEYKIRARETHHRKNSIGYVNGRAILRDKFDKIIQEKRIYGEAHWGDHWMTYTGNKDAVKNSNKHLRGSKENPYPAKKAMVQSAASNLTGSLDTFFKGLSKIVR